MFDKLQKAEKFTGQRWKPRGQGAVRVKRTRLAVSASKSEQVRSHNMKQTAGGCSGCAAGSQET